MPQMHESDYKRSQLYRRLRTDKNIAKELSAINTDITDGQLNIMVATMELCDALAAQLINLNAKIEILETGLQDGTEAGEQNNM